MSGRVKEYSAKGFAESVHIRRAQSTWTMVGVYHGLQSGIENNPETPWVTVCEKHSACVCHRTLAAAKLHAADPAGWCEDCATALATTQGYCADRRQS